jgi:hypothetical protein
MRKEVHPGAVAAVLIFIMLTVMVIYAKKTEPPPTQPMSPLGPGAAILRKHPELLQQAVERQREILAHGVMVSGNQVKPAPPELIIKARKEIAGEHERKSSAEKSTAKGETASKDANSH